MDAIRGSLSPTLLEGRAPAAPREILVGSKSADAIGAQMGDRVEGRIGKRATSFHVVGRGVLPELGTAGLAPLGLGRGVAMTFQGLRRLDPGDSPTPSSSALAPGADGKPPSPGWSAMVQPRRPSGPPTSATGDASAASPLLAALIAAAAAAMLAHALVTSIRRRRATSRSSRRSASNGATCGRRSHGRPRPSPPIGLLAGLPLGVGAGPLRLEPLRHRSRRRARGRGASVAGLLVIPATLLLANLVALLPGRIAAGTQPAAVLRAE